MQLGISRVFSVETLRSLAQLYIDNGFLTYDEADAFLSDIPVPGEMNLSPLWQTACWITVVGSLMV